MSFRVLVLKEHVSGEIHKIDSQILILYDPSEESFFYYGTRKRNALDMHITYNGFYNYTRINALANTLMYSLNNLDEVITHEMHNVHISKDEYYKLDFHTLFEKISRKTEIAAYDRININKDKLIELLDVLITHDLY